VTVDNLDALIRHLHRQRRDVFASNEGVTEFLNVKLVDFADVKSRFDVDFGSGTKNVFFTVVSVPFLSFCL